jgi:hypothetical protein
MSSQTYETTLLKEGPAEFEIDMVSDRDSQGNYHTSKSGNRLIKVKLHVIDSDGDVDSVWLNIIYQHLYRLRDLCESVGMQNVYKEYKQGHQVLEELIGKEGRCELVIKRDEQYGDKMDVKKFFPKNKKGSIGSMVAHSAQKVEVGQDENDKIPF